LVAARLFAYHWISIVTPLNTPLIPRIECMDSEFGLLWIVVGFLLIFASVAALFLTVTA